MGSSFKLVNFKWFNKLFHALILVPVHLNLPGANLGNQLRFGYGVIHISQSLGDEVYAC